MLDEWRGRSSGIGFVTVSLASSTSAIQPPGPPLAEVLVTGRGPLLELAGAVLKARSS